MPARTGIAVARGSHERLTALVADLDEAALSRPSYDTEWTIAQVLSHLGSQAEIFGLYLEAGLSGADLPGTEIFQPVWDSWNARGPLAVRADLVTYNDALLTRIETLPAEAAGAFRMTLFGNDVDLDGFARMRVNEHAVHTWDVAVALDPSATVAPEAVDVMIDGMAQVARYSGRPSGESFRVRVLTTAPERDVLVSVGDHVTLAPADASAATDGTVELPAEAFLRLVYGRLDAGHTPGVVESGARGLDDLRSTFKGV
jgi:uncharacterized protein (TIGR03083 family)